MGKNKVHRLSRIRTLPFFLRPPARLLDNRKSEKWPSTYDERRINLLQNLFLIQRHLLAASFLDSLLLQLLQSVHFARGSNLTSAYFAETAFA